MNNTIEIFQENRLFNFLFGIVWFILGMIFFNIFVQKIDLSSVILITFIILPSLIIPALALRNKIKLDKLNNTLEIQSLFKTDILLIDEIIDVKFPKYIATHIKSRSKRALYSGENFPYAVCYIVTNNNPDGVPIPFKSFEKEKFQAILEYIKSINTSLVHVEYPPNELF